MFDDLYYLDWELGILATAALLTFFLAYSFTEHFTNSLITTATIVGTIYVVFNHVM